ncbi:alpha/beta hydrolase family protein [Janthinobacterium lividum]|uniref:alpha/beta hydrolase family protein n=2 Tax=Oxalobacteraceae TaxID=75682 RepID=UPI0008741098|nr:alpha/beta hydrolase [Janthinobacterium lividum]OEZ57888.1 alpha/beta hydrolase family protein [Janthinobacterium lividum]WQE28452.1 alpha/beta hydrolase [Janthinobacterium lividum]STQ99395.1 Alpha/beta hydrolase family [Janthinobacterium lividum]
MTSNFFWPLLAVSFSATAAPMPDAFSPAPCETGIFRQDQTGFVAVTKGGKGYSYTFSDGTVGNTQDAGALVVCGEDAVLVSGKGRWPKVALAESNTRFESHGVMLAGRLMEAPGAGKDTPLVVYAHGSEGSGWIDRARDPYQMVGRGVSVFVYDKRGTGLSEGEYTQNFPRLADDLVAASREAKRLAQGRYGRFGLMGVSQGGWIAPLALARAKAQFLGIGYGLVADITEQDAAQVAMELRDKGYGGDVIAKARTATDITARIVKSGYRDGLGDLSAFQQQFGKEPWFSLIKGGYTGVLLGMPADELRKNGIPRFDKLDIDWSLDPVQVVSQVTAPQLWALAEDDRQAPPAVTVERLTALRSQGQAISVYLFPQADHGMRSYAQAPDGTRKPTIITPGFYDLMADWAKGGVHGAYGQAYRK